MNELERIQTEQGGLHRGGTEPRRPNWKSIHHSPFFWLSLVFLLLAMGIFVLSDYFMVRPRSAAEASVPASANARQP